MKTSMVFPSHNYNIVLDKDDLQQLLERGYISVPIYNVPCKTSRCYWDEPTKSMRHTKYEAIPNLLALHLEKDVADIKSGEQYVRYLGIALDNSCEALEVLPK